MASLKVSPDELRALDQARQRFMQLSNSIGSLKMDVHNANPLPSLASLHATEDIIFKDLTSLHDLIDQNSDLFQRLSVHPSTNFPGRTHENVLMQLIRKKLEPDVEELVEQGRVRGATVSAGPDGENPNGASSNGATNNTGGSAPPFNPSNNMIAAARTESINAEQLSELLNMWSEIRSWLTKRVVMYATQEAQELFTAAEKEAGEESARTGLQHSLDWDSEDEDADEETDQSAKRHKPEVFVDPERVLSFCFKLDPEMPANFDFESRRPKTKTNALPRR
ncbi:Mediator of RNA polymerase II transcription subunit 8 [Ceratocystis lukuohia]